MLGLIPNLEEDQNMHLISALLQQSLNKLPVGLCDDRRRQVGEFGLAECGAEVSGFLDVFLQ